MARGGSKGLPRKNVKLLDGKPLIAYTIEHALSSGVCDDVIVTTEDDEIAKLFQTNDDVKSEELISSLLKKIL